MSRAAAMKRTTLIFLGLGPVIGGMTMFTQFVLLDNSLALSELFSFGMIWMVIFFIIGGYVVGALPAAATGVLFSFVVSRRALNILEGMLLGAGAGFLTSAMAVVVIALINPGAPKWNWIIPLAGALAGTLCGGLCWILGINQHHAVGKCGARIRSPGAPSEGYPNFNRSEIAVDTELAAGSGYTRLVSRTQLP